MEGKIKTILFDLDGVIINTNNIHYNSLNKALKEYDKKFVISKKENYETYDGLKTQVKLKILTAEKKLPINVHEQIRKSKENYTLQEFSKIKLNKKITNLFKSLKDNGYILGCCTNNNKSIALMALNNLDIVKYLDVIITYDDVVNEKPHPEMYLSAIDKLKSVPTQTLIIEDSKQGIISGKLSGSFVLEVKPSNELKLELIYNAINFIETNY